MGGGGKSVFWKTEAFQLQKREVHLRQTRKHLNNLLFTPKFDTLLFGLGKLSGIKKAKAMSAA